MPKTKTTRLIEAMKTAVLQNNEAALEIIADHVKMTHKQLRELGDALEVALYKPKAPKAPASSISVFPKTGEINIVLNEFANFIWGRTALDERGERKFVKKLQSLSGLTNTPLSLIQQRIDGGDVNWLAIHRNVENMGIVKGIVEEMKDAVKRHTKHK